MARHFFEDSRLLSALKIYEDWRLAQLALALGKSRGAVLVNGGRLELDLGPEPNKSWGTEKEPEIHIE